MNERRVGPETDGGRGWTAVRHILLGPAHVATGRTRHYFGDRLLPPPKALQIVRYRQGPTSYYLFYLDEAGREVTDTWHERIESALRQAHWEFGVGPDEWEILQEDPEE